MYFKSLIYFYWFKWNTISEQSTNAQQNPDRNTRRNPTHRRKTNPQNEPENTKLTTNIALKTQKNMKKKTRPPSGIAIHVLTQSLNETTAKFAVRFCWNLRASAETSVIRFWWNGPKAENWKAAGENWKAKSTSVRVIAGRECETVHLPLH